MNSLKVPVILTNNQVRQAWSTSVFNKGRRPAKLAGYFTPTRRLLWKYITPIFFHIMRNICPGSGKFFSKKKKANKKNVTWNLSSFGPAAINFFDRSNAHLLSSLAYSLNRGFWVRKQHNACVWIFPRALEVTYSSRLLNKLHACFCVPLNKKSPKLMMSVFCSNSLIHAPECGKCILREPNFQNFPGEHAPVPP